MKSWGRLASAIRERRIVSGLHWRCRKQIDAGRERYLRFALKQTSCPCATFPCISLHGDFDELPESRLLKQALDESINDISKLPDWVRNIYGMSGQKYRTFINNLIAHHPDPRYLEIGSWQGSTAVAAIYGNSIKAVCIDNWSEFGGPKSKFLANIKLVQSPRVDVTIIENDFRQVDYASLEPSNVYLFDGPHSEADQFDAILIVRPALEDRLIFIVDDWNRMEVRLGTFRGIQKARYTIASSIEIQVDTYPPVTDRESDWHQGYFIAVLVAN